MTPKKRPGAPFSVDRATRALDFIRALKQPKDRWAGEPFQPRPWQEAVIRELFGRMRADDPTRRAYRTCYFEVPRKNGKTTLAAALGLYGLIGERVQGAEVYLAANDREQASLVYDAMAQMVRFSTYLSKRLKVLPSQKRIIDPETGSVARAISAEAYSKHGFNASLVIYDELHAAQTRDLWDVLLTSMGARWEPLMVAITTAGFDRTSICWEQHEYAMRVLSGVVTDPTFLPVIYAAPEAADWTDEAVWRAANPALEDFRDLDEMRMHAARAKVVPAQQNTFRRLYLNQWTEQAERFIDMQAWRACQASPPDEALAGVPCYGGLDLGMSDDFSAWVRIWPLEDGRVVVKSQFWVPEAALEKYPTRPYRAWRDAGLLDVTPGPTTDYDTIEAAVMRDCLRDGVREVGYDNRFAEQLAQHLLGAGIVMVNTPQGFQLNEAITRKTELIAAGLLCHGQHEILTWMASNYVVRHGTKGDVRPDKQRAGEKIDGQVALDMAIGRWIPQATERPSPFDGKADDEIASLIWV